MNNDQGKIYSIRAPCRRRRCIRNLRVLRSSVFAYARRRGFIVPVAVFALSISTPSSLSSSLWTIAGCGLGSISVTSMVVLAGHGSVMSYLPSVYPLPHGLSSSHFFLLPFFLFLSWFFESNRWRQAGAFIPILIPRLFPPRIICFRVARGMLKSSTISI